MIKSDYTTFCFKSFNLLFLCCLLIACSYSNEKLDNSTAFKPDNYKGKWVILNYWAEWCVPCLKEIPELNVLNEQYSSELAVLAVNFDNISGSELQTLAKKMGITFSIIDPDPADILRLSRPAALPTTYIYNRKGELTAKLVGPQTAQTLLARTDIKL